jgi:muconolactone delta-isomerase
MPDEFPDPKKIWQEQPTEAIEMSLEEIRRKAHQFQAKGRWKALIAIVIGIALCGVFAVTSAKAQYLVLRIGWGVLSLYGLFSAYQAYKWIWPSSLAADATVGTSLEFYRRELERRRDYVRHIWRRSGVWWCFVGLALIILPAMMASLKNPKLLLNAVPFFVLLSVWFVAFFSIRKRQRQKLQREIDELNALQR